MDERARGKRKKDSRQYVYIYVDAWTDISYARGQKVLDQSDQRMGRQRAGNDNVGTMPRVLTLRNLQSKEEEQQ